MKKLLLGIVLMLTVVAGGCQTTSYRWINTDFGFPNECNKTITWKGTTINYCLVSENDSGDYYLEGVFRSRDNHSLGDIMHAKFELALYNGDERVFLTSLNRKGRSMDRPIYLSKAFHFDGEFDDVTFFWNVTYKF